MVATPKITIVIPNWNGKSMLGHCLHSLQNQSIDNFDVIVVDNGSVDGSAEFLRQEFPAVQCICLSQNTGFSYAVNCGIDAASADWVLLLNNDMEVAADCLERLAEAVNTHPEFEFFALKMLDFADRDYLDGAGDGVMRGGVGYRLGTMEQDQPYYSSDRETFGACAGAALYSKRFFAVAGLFDPDFFAYLEDVDLNLRARRCGLRCLYLADARVYHVGSATSGSKINPLTIRLSTRNNIWVIVKNYPVLLFLRFFMPLFIYQLAWLLFCMKKKMFIPYVQGITAGIGGMKNMRQKGEVQKDPDQLIPLRQFGDLIVAGERDVIRSIMARRSSVGKGNLLLKIYSALFL
jgi:GT2 family glycosyltransferase